MNSTDVSTEPSNDSCVDLLLVEQKLYYTDPWFWLYFSLFVFLMLFSGLMSGLTLGLFSLDQLNLNVLSEGGTAKQRQYAKKVLPLVRRHHLLLVTLVLANAAAVESMPLCMDRISNPVVAICVSTTAVLLFGEVIPQAICARYGLAIGAKCTPLVYLLMAAFFVIAWPLSKVLDMLLGKDSSVFFRRSELKVLIDLHGAKRRASSSYISGPSTPTTPPRTPTGASNELPCITVTEQSSGAEALTADEVTIIKGALEMTQKTARHAMITIDQVFMIGIDDKLDTEAMLKLTHSRIPVYEGDSRKIVGLLIVKALLALRPEERLTVRQLANTPALRPVPAVSENTPLYDLLNQFQLGKSHLALVKKESGGSEAIIGIITLEDVIEELIQEEILDEADNTFQKARSDLLKLMITVGKRGGTSRTSLSNATLTPCASSKDVKDMMKDAPV